MWYRPAMILLFIACGAVNVEDGGLFPVLSAFSFPSWPTEGVWVSGGGLEAGDLFSDHAATLTDLTLGCSRAVAYQQQWNDASDALLDASDGGEDVAAFCAGAPDFLAALDAASDSFPPELQRLGLSFRVEDGDDPFGGDVPAGVHEFDGDTVDVHGYYRRDRDVERVSLADHWNAEACAIDWDAADAADGKLDVELYDIVGTVTIEEGDGQVLSGSWQGALAGDGDLDGKDGSGSFSTALCEVPEPDRLVFPWF